MKLTDLPRDIQDEIVDQLGEAYKDRFATEVSELASGDMTEEECMDFWERINSFALDITEVTKTTFEQLSDTAPEDVSEEQLVDATVYLVKHRYDTPGFDPEGLSDDIWGPCDHCEGKGCYEGLNTVEDPCETCDGEGYEFLPSKPDLRLTTGGGDEIIVQEANGNIPVSEMKDQFNLIERAENLAEETEGQ